MKNKIVGIFVMTLLIAATILPVVMAVNIQTTQYVNENNDLETNLCTPASSLGIITIKIVGLVKDVDDPYNLLGGAIKVGDRITGKYIYESGTLDSDPDPQKGEYWHFSSTFGIELNAGGFVFKTDPSNANFLIFIGNNYNQCDFYSVYCNNNLPLSNGMLVHNIQWVLDDDTCTALSSDALPTKAPDLLDWKQTIGLIIYIDDPYDPFTHCQIKASVNKAIKNKAKDVYFIEQPILIWLLERFPNMFPILQHLKKL